MTQVGTKATQYRAVKYFLCFVDSVPIEIFDNRNTSGMRIILDNVICRGREANLLQCTHNGIEVHNCDLTEVAGVKCRGTFLFSSNH